MNSQHTPYKTKGGQVRQPYPTLAESTSCSLNLGFPCSFARQQSHHNFGRWQDRGGTKLPQEPLGFEIFWFNSLKMSENPTACTVLQMDREAQDQ